MGGQLTRALLLALALIATPAAAQGDRDRDLYRDIVSQMRAGDGYYDAATATQRARRYPLKPFVTVRLPTLAVVQSTLPHPAVLALFYGQIAAVVIGWSRRIGWRAAPALAAGCTVFLAPGLFWYHEPWAALLIALSLLARQPGRWTVAVLLGLGATLVREIAAPYLLVMGGLALLGGHRREALAWGAAVAGLALALWLHAQALAPWVQPGDLASPGWHGQLGPALVVSSLHLTTALRYLPHWVAVLLLLPLSLLGWVLSRDQAGLRTTATLLAFATMIGLFGRANSFYWAYLIAPLSIAGLVLLPRGLAQLKRGPRQRIEAPCTARPSS